ncbi:MAG: SRPBCC domain-containing protein [Flavipsychrobacter sp.]|jgi:activator of HSP90 ATPase
MAYDLELEFVIPGAPKQTMQMLTDTALIRKWSGEEAVLEPQVGGKFQMFDGWVSGEVKKLTDKELAYSWKPVEWEESTAPSEVHFLLSSDKEGTKVILHHTNLPTQEEADEQKQGWDDYFFGPLEEYIYATKRY